MKSGSMKSGMQGTLPVCYNSGHSSGISVAVASETMAARWVRMPGLRGYVLLSMVLHVLFFAVASQYRATPLITQMPPVIVRLVPPFMPSPIMPSPSVRVPEQAPDVMDSAPGAAGMRETPEEAGRRSVEPDTEGTLEQDRPDAPDAMEGEVATPGREAIFDSEVIARHAEEPAGSGQDETGITFDTTEVALSGYMGRLKHKIENAWEYPYSAAKDGIYGDLKISFVIRRDGTLGEVRVVRTSGHVVLDEAAMKALRAAEPFWPLPELFQKEALLINGRFIYTLSGRHVR